MLKALGEWFRKKQQTRCEARRVVVRQELESLFQDDFEAHALIAKSSKAAAAQNRASA